MSALGELNSDAEGTASHLQVLRWAHQALGGTVLEFGGGLFSTSYLHDAGIASVTVEADPEWRAWLRSTYPGHDVVPADPGGYWDVVLIDDGEGEWAWIDHRAALLASVRGRCGIALVHDWHIGPGHRDDVVGSYAYHGWFAPDDGRMHTAICSQTVPIADALIPGGRVYTGWHDAPEVYPN